MKILLATGFTEIEKDVLNNLVKRGDNCWRCYHRQTVMDMVTEYGVKTVVLGPSLDGTKDIYQYPKNARGFSHEINWGAR